MNRRRFGRVTKDDLIRLKSGGRCFYCGASLNRETFTRDHVIPRSLGGPTAVANLVSACLTCNQRKGDRDVEDFRRDCFGGERFYAERRHGDVRRDAGSDPRRRAADDRAARSAPDQ